MGDRRRIGLAERARTRERSVFAKYYNASTASHDTYSESGSDPDTRTGAHSYAYTRDNSDSLPALVADNRHEQNG